jgi:hypothetical protein
MPDLERTIDEMNKNNYLWSLPYIDEDGFNEEKFLFDCDLYWKQQKGIKIDEFMNRLDEILEVIENQLEVIYWRSSSTYGKKGFRTDEWRKVDRIRQKIQIIYNKRWEELNGPYLVYDCPWKSKKLYTY